MLRFPILAALGALALPAAAQVRISQVYTAGGTVGAPLLSDYVELYNSGLVATDLTGWSVQYASAAGSTWSVTQLPSVLLQPGQYLLVKELDGTALPSGQTAPLPAPDATGSIGLSTTDGKLALCSVATPLSGTQPVSPSIVDFVGYGPNASWREPFVGGTSANNAPSGSPTSALYRGLVGLGDSNDNAADFVLGHPIPRGRSHAAHAGWTVHAQCVPYFGEAGQSVKLVVEVLAADGSSAPPSTLVTVNLAPVGGSSAQVLADDGLGPDELAGDGLFTGSFVVGAGTTLGGQTLEVFATTGALTGGGFTSLLVKPASTADNDECSRAQPLAGAFPLVASGDFVNCTAESSPVLHESSFIETMGARRGAWFTVIGTGNTMTADTCASPLIGGVQIPDTVMAVLTGSCGGLTRIGFGDDLPQLCGAGGGVERRSRVNWCSSAGTTYFVWIAAFNTTPGTMTYVLTVNDDGVACTGAASGAICTPGSAPAASELEPAFGPATNDGCDALVPRFRDVAVGPVQLALRGHARSLGMARDRDWIRFQAPYSETLAAVLTAPFLGRIGLFELSPTGGCAGAALVAQSFPGERCTPLALNAAVSAGAWYAVRIDALSATDTGVIGGIGVGPSSSSWRLTLQLGDVPVNDDCAQAIDLSCGGVASGKTAGASAELANVPLHCAGPGEGTSGAFDLTSPGVWYRVVVPGAPGTGDRTVYVETTSADFDVRLTVFEGACGSLACVTANDDAAVGGRSVVGWRARASQDYFVLVHGNGVGHFELAADCAPIPANDEGLAALAIGVPGFASTTTVGATGAAFAFPLGGAGGMAPCAANGPAAESYFDTWCELVAPCDGRLHVSTCGVEDTLLSVHTAVPTTSSSFALPGACSDDGPAGCAPGSQVSFDATAGATYFLRIARTSAHADGGPVLVRVSVGDSDGDGVDDCADGCPLDPLKLAPGACGCGVADTDSDGDGTPDCNDACPFDPAKTAPGVCGCGVSELDSDGDGTPDCIDLCPADPNKIAPGVCGCGVSDVDTDGDGTADCIDGCPQDPNKIAPGVCGCGVSDVDTDGDGTADCVDACPLDPNKTAPGVCGCGVSDVDTDGDGTADCIDACPLDPNKIAPGVCGCGVPDTDGDGDQIPDCVDNCPALANPSQADCDGDGLGDACAIASGASYDLDLDGVPDECEFGASIAYCTATTSFAGCVASISGLGVPSASATTSFVVHATGIDGLRNGLVFYGINGPAAQPFGSGVLCMVGPRQRTLVTPTGGSGGACDGTIDLDWNAYVAAPNFVLGEPFSAGDLVWAQAWWRDAPSQLGTALSPALQFTLAP